MRPLATLVCLCVCLIDTTVIAAKTAEPIEMSFRLWTRVGPRNHKLGGGGDPSGKGQFGGHLSDHCKV